VDDKKENKKGRTKSSKGWGDSSGDEEEEQKSREIPRKLTL